VSRSLQNQILCEKVSPPAAERKTTDAGRACNEDRSKLSNTTRVWLMRLQRLECDYFECGPDTGEAGLDWMHGRPQHERQAFFESMWAGYRTGTLALRKTFTAWRCLAVLQYVNCEQIREHGLQRIQEVFEHLFRRFSIYHSLSLLHAWAQVVRNERSARRLREQEASLSHSFQAAVRALVCAGACSFALGLDPA
jgi:hypothetical protein